MRDRRMTGLVKKLLFCGAKSFPSDLSEGHIWVSVGTEQERKRRFELKANILNHPLFEDILILSGDENGYSYQGAVRITCEINIFLGVIELLRSNNSSVHTT